MWLGWFVCSLSMCYLFVHFFTAGDLNHRFSNGKAIRGERFYSEKIQIEIFDKSFNMTADSRDSDSSGKAGVNAQNLNFHTFFAVAQIFSMVFLSCQHFCHCFIANSKKKN